MFLNESAFIKLIKKAYRTKGVVIANIDNTIVIDIGDVLTAIQQHMVTNRIKALIVELAGGYPNSNTAFRVIKQFQKPQVTEEVLEEINIKISGCRYAVNKLVIMPLIATSYSDTRLLHTNNNKVFAIKEILNQIIDKYAVDLCLESEPTGPAYGEDPNKGIYWYNDSGMVVIKPSAMPENSDIIKALEPLIFEDKKKSSFDGGGAAINEPTPEELPDEEISEELLNEIQEELATGEIDIEGYLPDISDCLEGDEFSAHEENSTEEFQPGQVYSEE